MYFISIFHDHLGQGIHGVVQNSTTNNGNVVMMVQPGGAATNGNSTGTVSPSIQRIPLPGKYGIIFNYFYFWCYHKILF